MCFPSVFPIIFPTIFQIKKMKSIKANSFFAALICTLSLLSSCSYIDDDMKGCPADMLLSFHIDDPHEAGDFDTRVGNDVLLYIFRDGVCVSKIMVPYSEIAQGKSYAIRKTAQICGNLQIVAWAVPANGDMSVLPSWKIGDPLGSTDISLESLGREGYYAAVTNQLYLGTFSTTEAVDEPTSHSIGMNYSYCRVEVRVTDPSGKILDVPGGASVRVLGSMSAMNMQQQGTGKEAIVVIGLDNPDGDNIHYTTGRFGIYPSRAGETISIGIYAGDTLVATLTVPAENIPRGAESGGLLVFEYTLESDSFTLIVNGYRVNIYNVDRV